MPPIAITLAFFQELPDPRVERTKVHSLEVIMFIALCTYLSGGEGFYDMEAYALAKKKGSSPLTVEIMVTEFERSDLR